jgi:hypothetical protein
VNHLVPGRRPQPDEPEGRVADRVERRDRPAEDEIEQLERPGDPQGGHLGVLEGDALRSQLAGHDVEARDHEERDPHRDRVRRRRGPAPDEPPDRRLEEMREGGLPDPAQGERGHGDPELARGDVGVQVHHHLVGQTRPSVPLARELLQA